MDYDTAFSIVSNLRGSVHKQNPLDELLYIICSLKTDEDKYLGTYSSLKRAFPTFEGLASASEVEIAASIRSGGLYNQKAKTIAKLMDAILERFGKPTLAPLRKMSDDECEAFLTSLPGVGKKTARCVMMLVLPDLVEILDLVGRSHQQVFQPAGVVALPV